jgi:hypothetical protein
MQRLHLSIPCLDGSSKECGGESKADDARRQQEAEIQIMFELPDGSEVHEKVFRLEMQL